MGKYAPLADKLSRLMHDQVMMKVADIDGLVGGLPPSARADRTWWGNTTNRTRVQTHAWMGAGWRVERVDLTTGHVVFVRDGGAGLGRQTHG